MKKSCDILKLQMKCKVAPQGMQELSHCQKWCLQLFLQYHRLMIWLPFVHHLQISLSSSHCNVSYIITQPNQTRKAIKIFTKKYVNSFLIFGSKIKETRKQLAQFCTIRDVILTHWEEMIGVKGNPRSTTFPITRMPPPFSDPCKQWAKTRGISPCIYSWEITDNLLWPKPIIPSTTFCAVNKLPDWLYPQLQASHP